ncbi:hypothetical protein FRC19_008388 [Serendipita sp. 401]|nr:hypothetical protein FRC19_008388 [Serendipita sp. 401]KAG9058766.1 hypothetical protein FS842_003555 [Serendipita sp. 407]
MDYDVESAVKASLRDSERCAFVIDTNPGSQRVISPTYGSNNSALLSTRRVIAIITHEEGGKEHAGLFIYKWNRIQPQSLVLVTVLPLTADMQVALAQVTSETPLSPGPRSSSTTRSDCMVNIFSDGKEFSFVCDQNLAIALQSQCGRLKDSEQEDDMEVGRTRSWMAVYGPSAGDRKTISEFIRPHDLRLLVHDLPLSSSYAGFPGDEEADTILIHDDWVRKQIQARKGEFSTSHKIRIRVGTFNVNGQLPNHSIASWIRGGLSTEATGTRRNILESPDILIFGFQELDLSAGALLYSTSTLLEEQWSTSILKCLEGHPASYIKFASRQLVGMLILGFVRKAQRPYISEISTTSLGIGIMGLMGNKGAVGLRFRFRSSVITCVCSHLAANDGMAEKRNYDYLQISHRMQFPLNAATPAEAAEPLRPVSSTIFETHILIWLGGMNQSYSRRI